LYINFFNFAYKILFNKRSKFGFLEFYVLPLLLSFLISQKIFSIFDFQTFLHLFFLPWFLHYLLAHILLHLLHGEPLFPLSLLRKILFYLKYVLGNLLSNIIILFRQICPGKIRFLVLIPFLRLCLLILVVVILIIHNEIDVLIDMDIDLGLIIYFGRSYIFLVIILIAHLGEFELAVFHPSFSWVF